MRTYLLAVSSVVSIAALTSAANAADMAPAPSVYDWSGVYIGLNAGVAWSNSEVDGSIDCSSVVLGGCEDFDGFADDLRHGVDDGGAAFTGGAMIGANWQWESLVLGVEADVNYANFGDSSRDSFEWDGGRGFPPGTWTTRAEYDADWWGTARARIGFAADNLLFYGTGGLAWGTIDASASVEFCPEKGPSCSSLRGSESSTNLGWTIGAGMEWGWDNWTFGAEYLYVDLGDADFDHNGRLDEFAFREVDSIQPLNTYSGNAEVDYQFSVVRATFKYKF
jgi:outer membrane immunogenic protein